MLTSVIIDMSLCCFLTEWWTGGRGSASGGGGGGGGVSVQLARRIDETPRRGLCSPHVAAITPATAIRFVLVCRGPWPLQYVYFCSKWMWL